MMTTPYPFAFGRLITAMVTPFNDHLDVDYDKAALLAKKLIREGNDGLVVAGTTGESPTLSHEEKIKLFKVVKEAVGASIPVIAGTGSNSTRETILLTQEAEHLGMDGALVVCPYYNKPPQEGLYRHFKMVAEKTGLPIMIYNIPGRTGVNMLPETVERLCEIPNIVGIKEAAGSVEQAAEMARRTMRRPVAAGSGKGERMFAVWSGDDALTLPFMSVGAVGVVSVAGHLVAPQLKAMMSAFVEGKVEEARSRHAELQDLFKALFVITNPIQVKAAMGLAGFPAGGLRPPLVDAGEKDLQLLRDAMNPLNLLA